MRSARVVAVTGVLLAALGAGSCSTSEGDRPSPAADERSRDGPATTAPASPRTGGTSSATADDDSGGDGVRLSDWEVGARPLPLRPDGFGVVRKTPAELRDRRLPTADVLPPPPGERFRATIRRVTPETRRRMGETWSPACPVGLDDLRHLTLTFRGFDGLAHTGELVVAVGEARDVVSVFRALYAADFPIEEMRLPTTADLEAPPTGDGNNTAGLVCRAARGTTTWSAHAYGLAIDLNPFHNPYRKGDLVLPELASAYLDRSRRRPGMVLPGSLAVREFARIGWSWGGDWSGLKDYQHFTATGR